MFVKAVSRIGTGCTGHTMKTLYAGINIYVHEKTRNQNYQICWYMHSIILANGLPEWSKSKWKDVTHDVLHIRRKSETSTNSTLIFTNISSCSELNYVMFVFMSTHYQVTIWSMLYLYDNHITVNYCYYFGIPNFSISSPRFIYTMHCTWYTW